MINNATVNNVKSAVFNGSASHVMGIDCTPEMYDLLSKSIYNNPIEAPIRELCCNAYDAHVTVGREDEPFEVHIPTNEEPWFSVQDFGCGMTHEQILNNYGRFGASSKRDSNDYIGCLGIGSKSPLAYTDSFTVETCRDGVRRTYGVTLESGIPKINEMGSAPSNITGTYVKFNVKSVGDISKFKSTAYYILAAFKVQPSTNVTIPEGIWSEDPVDRIWSVRKYADIRSDYNTYSRGLHANYVLMGNVIYSIPSQMDSAIGIDWDIRGLIFEANIGDVKIAATRESIIDNEENRKYLREMLDDAKIKAYERACKLFEGLTSFQAVAKLVKIGDEVFGKSKDSPSPIVNNAMVREVNKHITAVKEAIYVSQGDLVVGWSSSSMCCCLYNRAPITEDKVSNVTRKFGEIRKFADHFGSSVNALLKTYVDFDRIAKTNIDNYSNTSGNVIMAHGFDGLAFVSQAKLTKAINKYMVDNPNVKRVLVVPKVDNLVEAGFDMKTVKELTGADVGKRITTTNASVVVPAGIYHAFSRTLSLDEQVTAGSTAYYMDVDPTKLKLSITSYKKLLKHEGVIYTIPVRQFSSGSLALDDTLNAMRVVLRSESSADTPPLVVVVDDGVVKINVPDATVVPLLDKYKKLMQSYIKEHKKDLQTSEVTKYIKTNYKKYILIKDAIPAKFKKLRQMLDMADAKDTRSVYGEDPRRMLCTNLRALKLAGLPDDALKSEQSSEFCSLVRKLVAAYPLLKHLTETNATTDREMWSHYLSTKPQTV